MMDAIVPGGAANAAEVGMTLPRRYALAGRMREVSVNRPSVGLATPLVSPPPGAGYLAVRVVQGSLRLRGRARARGELLRSVVGLEEDPVGHDGVDRLVRAFDYQLRAEHAVLDGDHRVADVLLQPR